MSILISFSLVSSHFSSLFGLLIIILRFAYYPIFMFIVYNSIYRQKAEFSYSLLIKFGFWDKIKNLITKLSLAQLVAIATKIKKINRCTNPALKKLETHIQTRAAHTLYSMQDVFSSNSG